MSRIESRPSKRELGEYVFFVDITWPPIDVIQQQKIDQQLEAAMEELKPLCERLISFGSYPITDDTSLP
mgnify:FL=1